MDNTTLAPRLQGVSPKKYRMFPDAAWLNREPNIREVARALGLTGDERNFDCFRESHPQNKPRRALSVHGKTNTMRCFSCDKHQLSPIDLTSQVLGVSIGQAITWLDERFHAPRIRSAPATPPKSGKYKAEMTLENLIRAPRWATLNHPEQAALAAIAARCPQAGSEKWSMRCSYAMLAEWLGTSKRTACRIFDGLRRKGCIRTATVHTGRVTKRGIWIKQLYVTISAMVLQPLAATGATATSYEAPNMASAVRSATDGAICYRASQSPVQGIDTSSLTVHRSEICLPDGVVAAQRENGTGELSAKEECAVLARELNLSVGDLRDIANKHGDDETRIREELRERLRVRDSKELPLDEPVLPAQAEGHEYVERV